MAARRTLRRLHIYSGLFSSTLGIYLWLEPKWRRWRRKAALKTADPGPPPKAA